MVDSLCLQWNCTPWQLVDYIFFHLSNLHSTIFIFYFFAKRWVMFVRNLRHYVRLGKSVQISSHVMWESFLGCHDTTFKAGKDGVQILWFCKILNVEGVPFESHQRCLPSSPKGVEEVGGHGFRAACHLRVRCEGHSWLLWVSDSTPRRLEHK